MQVIINHQIIFLTQENKSKLMPVSFLLFRLFLKKCVKYDKCFSKFYHINRHNLSVSYQKCHLFFQKLS